MHTSKSPYDVPTKEILDIERSKSSFDYRKLTNVITGSEETTATREKAFKLIREDPLLLDTTQTLDLNRKELRERCVLVALFINS
jgi:hypothetical protein